MNATEKKELMGKYAKKIGKCYKKESNSNERNRK